MYHHDGSDETTNANEEKKHRKVALKFLACDPECLQQGPETSKVPKV